MLVRPYKSLFSGITNSFHSKTHRSTEEKIETGYQSCNHDGKGVVNMNLSIRIHQEDT